MQKRHPKAFVLSAHPHQDDESKNHQNPTMEVKRKHLHAEHTVTKPTKGRVSFTGTCLQPLPYHSDETIQLTQMSAKELKG